MNNIIEVKVPVISYFENICIFTQLLNKAGTERVKYIIRPGHYNGDLGLAGRTDPRLMTPTSGPLMKMNVLLTLWH